MKRWFFVIFLGLPGVVASSLLGLWQYNRLLEKEAIIAKIESGLKQPPKPLFDKPHEFSMVKVSGEWTPHVFYLEAKPLDGRIGFHLVQVLKTSPTNGVLVKRGWVSEKRSEYNYTNSRHPEPLVPDLIRDHSGSSLNQHEMLKQVQHDAKSEMLNDPESIPALKVKRNKKPHTVQITGQIRYPHQNFFSPENRPDQWHSIDPKAMSEIVNLKLDNFYILEESPETGIKGLDLDPKLPNNHRQYMYFWFILSAIWAILTIYYARQRN